MRYFGCFLLGWFCACGFVYFWNNQINSNSASDAIRKHEINKKFTIGYTTQEKLGWVGQYTYANGQIVRTYTDKEEYYKVLKQVHDVIKFSD